MTTPPNPFAAPGAAGGGPRVKDLGGCLLVFRPRIEIYRWAQGAQNKPREYAKVIACAVHVLTSPGPIPGDGGQLVQPNPQQPLYIPELLVFNKPLHNQLRAQINPDGAGMVLGRLIKGPPRDGGVPPWEIALCVTGSPDHQMAMAWHAAFAANLPPLPALPVSDPQADPKATAAPMAPAGYAYPPQQPPAAPYGYPPQQAPAAYGYQPAPAPQYQQPAPQAPAYAQASAPAQYQPAPAAPVPVPQPQYAPAPQPPAPQYADPAAQQQQYAAAAPAGVPAPPF